MNRPKYIDGVKCSYDETSVTIHESYKIDYYDIWEFCYNVRRELPYVYKRSVTSWVKEIAAHNFLYKLNIFKSRTANTNLDENEKWFKLLAFHIVYGIFQFWFFFAT